MICIQRFLAFFLCFSLSSVWATIPATLTPSKAKMGEIIRLTLKLGPNAVNRLPDLTILRSDFAVVGSEQRTNYSMINGTSSLVHELTILLVAKKTGPLTIPALSIGSDSTNPVRVDITEQAENATGSSGTQGQQSQAGVFIQTSVQEQTPFVNQQVHYQVKIFVKDQIMDAQYLPPEVDNALVITLGQEQQYQTQLKGETYTVSEQNYALFPQKSGVIKVKPPQLHALIYTTFPEKISVSGQPIVLKVQPEPQPFGTQNWLPAKAVFLSEQYDKPIDTLKQGTTFTRMITIKAIGLPAQLLPTLPLSSTDAFTVYPEKAHETNEQVQSDIVGTMTIKANYLFNKSGTQTIPELKIQWFNLNTRKQETATIAARTIKVLSAPSDEKTVDIVQPPVSKVKIKAPTVQASIPSNASTLPWIIVAIIAFLWVLTLILGWFYLRKKKEPNPKKIFKQLQAACLANQAEAAEKYLLLWACWRWPHHHMHNLEDLSQLSQDKTLKDALNNLAKTLYQKEQAPWNGKVLWQAIQKVVKTDRLGKEKSQLPSLQRME